MLAAGTPTRSAAVRPWQQRRQLRLRSICYRAKPRRGCFCDREAPQLSRVIIISDPRTERPSWHPPSMEQQRHGFLPCGSKTQQKGPRYRDHSFPNPRPPRGVSEVTANPLRQEPRGTGAGCSGTRAQETPEQRFPCISDAHNRERLTWKLRSRGCS